MTSILNHLSFLQAALGRLMADPDLLDQDVHAETLEAVGMMTGGRLR
jgi:hypothetical protein